MARLTAQRKRFKSASAFCIKEAGSWGAFGKCMKSKLGGRQAQKSSKKARKSRRARRR